MWMAYFLSNTILFSPALELESVDYIDIHRVFQRLYTMISEDEIQISRGQHKGNDGDIP